MSCGADGHEFKLFTGDLEPLFIADAKRICDPVSGPVDWTGWALSLELRGPVVVTGAIIGTSLGVLTYSWVAGDTDIPGDYEPLVHGVSPQGKQRTFRIHGVVRITTA